MLPTVIVVGCLSFAAGVGIMRYWYNQLFVELTESQKEFLDIIERYKKLIVAKDENFARLYTMYTTHIGEEEAENSTIH